MQAISVTHDPALTAGIVNYELSAYLSKEFLETVGCKLAICNQQFYTIMAYNIGAKNIADNFSDHI